MSDREQLEFAAKAAGLRIVDRSHPVTLYVESEGCKGGVRWNPLTDDGDALRLAVRLGFINPGRWPDPSGLVAAGMDWNAATRRAIVRAAAEIGRQMQEGGAT